MPIPRGSLHHNSSLSTRSSLNPSLSCALLALVFAVGTLFASIALAAVKPIIEKKDDLPRHTYSIDLPVTALYSAEHRDALLALAMEVKNDIQSDLDSFDIQDDNTIQGFYAVLGTVAILEGDWQSYLGYLEKRRRLESKDANRLTMGLVGQAIAESQIAGQTSSEAVAERLQAMVSALPYKQVEANLESLKGRTEILSEALVLGSIESNFQPIVDKTEGEISYDVAASLVSASFTLAHFLPVAPAVGDVLAYEISTNKVEKIDIWSSREIALAEQSNASPVTMAVWDSGMDTNIFAASEQLWVNTDEIPGNGLDDDENGFVDDIHGIAFDVHAINVPELLYPIGEVADDEEALQRMVKGIGDIQFNVDSSEASDVRRQMAALPQEQVQEFLESLSLYGNYSHGTHVAGIASEGNPYARLLVARMTYGHELIPEKPTLAGAHREAAMFLDVADYFRRNEVRVVNMSWGGSLRDIEQALEAHAVGATPEARKALAREIYNIGDKALRRAIAESPDILFVTSAGNADNDIRFDEFYPSSYEYPNLLTVGAVDIAGEETSFTSLGKVDVYANGFEVESFVPGGNRIAYNGTSMSSPQVMNLAGKILAVHPELSVAELKELIISGATEKTLGDRSIRLINPKSSLELSNAAR